MRMKAKKIRRKKKKEKLTRKRRRKTIRRPKNKSLQILSLKKLGLEYNKLIRRGISPPIRRKFLYNKNPLENKSLLNNRSLLNRMKNPRRFLIFKNN
jgi:hypothetical protein